MAVGHTYRVCDRAIAEGSRVFYVLDGEFPNARADGAPAVNVSRRSTFWIVQHESCSPAIFSWPADLKKKSPAGLFGGRVVEMGAS